MFLYDEDGATRHPPPLKVPSNTLGNDEFYAKVVSEVVRLLATANARRVADAALRCSRIDSGGTGPVGAPTAGETTSLTTLA